MTSRRAFLAGALAAGLVPRPGWADAGSPAYLSAAARPDGGYVLCGISAAREVLFQIPLPGRGHAAAAHPERPEAVAFARRPGTFAIVLDCAEGTPKATLSAPAGRHFYGHGAFSRDGAWLYTTENDYDAGRGRIGVWDAAHGYQRVAEFDSGGIGPHDIRRLPGGDTLVVANGGIDTHPETGRTKLNIPTMAPNLSYIADGRVVETAAPPAEWHKNSIRHLAVSEAGQVAFGMQWQGDGASPALIGFHRRDEAVLLASAPAEELRKMDGYVGSIAFSGTRNEVVATSPRGGVVQVYDARDGGFRVGIALPDASGVAPCASGVLLSSGTGRLVRLAGGSADALTDLRWDNHLIAV